MIGIHRVLAVIPARGGSKGLRAKNIRLLAGRPLISWTILAARQSRYIDRLITSTDDRDIARVAEEYGCEVPFTRPSSLATDTASSSAVLLHAIEHVAGNYDIAILLQPTSPFRSARDIDGALEMLVNREASTVVSVAEMEKSPLWAYRLRPDGGMEALMDVLERPGRRQEVPALFVPNGAVYAVWTARFAHTHEFVDDESVAWVMPRLRSIDIDTQLDLDVAECLWQKYPELLQANQ